MLKSFTAASSGDYTLQIDGPCTSGVPAVCGNGFIDDGEQCDDSNIVDGDGCSAICEIEDGPPGPTPDNEAPVITVPGDIVAEATGAAGAVVVFPFATATDNSGVVVVAQTAGPVSGSTFPIGLTTVTFEATDPSGNTAQGSFTVTVLYIFGEFLPPLEDGKFYKANRTIPVKFQITFVGGEPVEEAIVGIQVRMLGVDDTPGEPIDLSTNETADTGGLFRFTNGQYIYNLSTQGFAPGMYRITAILSNGQAPYIDIRLK